MNAVREMIRDERHRNSTLRTKRTLNLIASKWPEGATQEDFKAAGFSPYGVGQLMKMKQVIGTQVKEPEHGPRCYHWVWTLNAEAGKKAEREANNVGPTRD